MSDDKKNISPEVETPTEAPAPGQPFPDKAEPVVTDPVPTEKTAPADKAEPAAPEIPGSAAPEQAKPEKEAQQTAIPNKGDPALASSGKVVDFAAARDEEAKDKAPKEKAPKQKAPEEKDKGTAKPRRGRPPKADKAAPDRIKPQPRDKMGVAEPEVGSARLPQYNTCILALVLDAWDSRGTQTADKAFADNPAFRRRLNQLKLTEPVRSESDTEV